MNLKEIKTLLAGTIKTAFTNKKTLDKFDDTSGTLKYNGVPVNNVPVFVADDAPVGNIISFMGNTAPKDYLICDGTEYQIADYPLLVQHFIYEFGSANYFGGDGETTFCVPDLRGEFLRGTGENSHENNGSGANVGEHQDATQHINLIGHAGNESWVLQRYSTEYVETTNIDKKIGISSGFWHNYSTNGSGTNGNNIYPSYASRPTNTSVLYCIKYQITQNNISKDMVNYSLEEQVIGSWIDGKPLYEKTIITIAPSTSANGTMANSKIDVTSYNIDTPIVVNCFARWNGSTLPIPYSTFAGHKLKVQFDNNSSLAVINEFKEYNNADIYVVLQYTKTTDAENSFTPDMLSSIKNLNTTASNEDVMQILGGI